jgi:outer membrane protein TolC
MAAGCHRCCVVNHRFGWTAVAILLATVAAAQAPVSPENRAKIGPPVVIQEPVEPAPSPKVVPPPPDSGLPPLSLTQPRHEKPLPINLATALALAKTRPLDIAIAAEQVRVAVAELDQAKVLWLPTLQWGADYFRHDGRNQDATSGVIFDNDRSTFMLGVGPTAIFAVTDAIFAPLAARQVTESRQASLRAASNDSFLQVAEAFFNVQQARGDVSGAEETVQLAEKLTRIVADLAPALASELEITRVRTETARRRQLAQAAWERWRLASIELTRVLRLDAAALILPLEPPQLQITLVAPQVPLEELFAVALTSRPELAAQQALVRVALERWRQEKYRPLLPSVLLRGASTNPTGTIAAGVYGSGVNDSIGHFGARLDYDVQVLWQLDNLGFGNLAKMDERRSEHQIARLEFLRLQDRILAEVAQGQAQVQSALARVQDTQDEVRHAYESVKENFEGLKQTKRAGNLLLLVVRPQEALASVQALGQAYIDYFEAIADFNRAQFRLYRALGNPANNPSLGPGLDPICSPHPGAAPSPG